MSIRFNNDKTGFHINSKGIMWVLFLSLLIFQISCKEIKDHKEDLLLRIGNKELTVRDVTALIPIGIHPADSTNLFQTIVDNWISNELLSDFAEQHLINLQEIERRVNDYRSKLIVLEYLKEMKKTHRPEVNEVDIKQYYDFHRMDLVTELPLVKGIFIKIDSEIARKDELRKLMSENKEENIDKIEKEWMDVLITYDYFRDRWVDWETVAGRIPYRFDDPDEFLKNHNYFETEYEDCSYYLLITDYLPSGSEQPYDFASQWISSLLIQQDIREYEKELVETLIKKAIDEKRIEIVGYDPITHAPIKN